MTAGPEGDPDPTAYDGAAGDRTTYDGVGTHAGPPAERRYPSTIGGAFYLVVLAVVLVGLALAGLGSWRLGVRLVAGGLSAAALVRLLLPQRDAGMLAVRHRLVDVIMLVVVAGVLFFLTATIPDQPGPP